MKIVLFRAFPDTYRQSMATYAEQLQNALSPLLREGEALCDFSLRNVRLAPRLGRYWSQYVRYPSRAARGQGDVNHILDHAYGHLLFSLDSKKAVVTVHDAIAFLNRKGPARSFNLAGIRRAAAVICVSEATRKAFLACCDYPAGQIEVIHEGVSEHFFSPEKGSPRERLGLPPGTYLLHVGHTKFYKNIPGLLRVLSILAHSLGRDVKLLRVGDPLSPEQLRLAERLGVLDRMVQVGILPQEKLLSAYRCADLLLLPSLDEGFGFPVLEAFAAGLPVVASSRGSLPEIVGDAGLLVDPLDAPAIARTVCRVLDESGLRQRLRESGPQRARGFTWEKTARKTLDVYRRVHREAAS